MTANFASYVYTEPFNPGAGTVVSRSDLYLTGIKPGRQWSASFQRYPARRIVLTGVRPTAEEVMESMAGSAQISMLMAECIVTAVLSAAEAKFGAEVEA